MAPGGIEAVAAAMAGPPGLTLGNLARPRPAWPSRAPGRWRSLPFRPCSCAGWRPPGWCCPGTWPPSGP